MLASVCQPIKPINKFDQSGKSLGQALDFLYSIREHLTEKNVFFRALPEKGGEAPAKFFGPFFTMY